MPPVLEARHIEKSFGRGERRLKVLQDINLCLEPGEIIAIAGSSGSGKSTLLHVLGGLMHPDDGSVHVSGANLYGQSEGKRARLRNQTIGFVYQMHHLLPEFTALENVVLPAWIAGRSTSEASKRALELLKFMSVADRAHHKPGELSGGEQQRVAMARALINDPDVVLADEPSGNLDEKASNVIHELLLQFANDRQQAFLVATHSPALARLANQTFWLASGKLSGSISNEEWNEFGQM